MRISEEDLKIMIKRLNHTAGTPEDPYAYDAKGAFKPQAKCFHLSMAYGGYALHQMCDTGSGVHDVFGGHVPKRELYDQIYAYIKGFLYREQYEG